MKKKMPFHGRGIALPILIATTAFISPGCQKSIDPTDSNRTASADLSISKPAKMLKDFTQVNLVANTAAYGATRVDPLLINGWGIAWSPTGTAWISSQGAGVSTVYNKEGGQQLAAVSIPSPGGNTGGNPSGQVFNTVTTDFRLSSNNNAARFIFAGLDGIISGWNSGSQAIKMIQRTGTSVYTGQAIGSTGGAQYLYAADFMSGRIDVFDNTWTMVNMSFTDPNLPAGYAPFNIQNLDGKLYVAYAEVGPDGRDVQQQGAGYVSVFNTDGSFVKRLVSKGQLNAPWGLAIAPASFFADAAVTEPAMLVGNFGDGTINVYTMEGNWLGVLRAHGEPIVIDGLWAISFAPPGANVPNRLYFAAGPNHELDGLFGYIIKDAN